MHYVHTKNRHSTIVTILGYSMYIFFLLAICFYSFKRPSYNWDMLAYMAVATSYENDNVIEVHDKVYQLAKEQLPPEKYRQLIDSTNKYKTSIANNAAEFNLQMPFYVVKPLYTGIVYLFHKAGFTLIKSTVLPSIVAYFFIGLLLIYWLKKYLPFYAALLLCLLIMLLPPILQVANLSTPDCLSAFLILWAIYFVVEKNRIAVPFILLLVSILARLDNVILCVLLFPILTLTGKLDKKISMQKHFLFLAIAVACYLIVSYSSISYGWNALYYPSFSKHLNAEHDIHQSFSMGSYFKLALTQIMVGLFYSYLSIFILLIALFCINISPTNKKKLGIDQVLLLLFLFIIMLKFILHPAVADRFYIAYYLVVIVFFIKKYAVLINSKTGVNINLDLVQKN